MKTIEEIREYRITFHRYSNEYTAPMSLDEMKNTENCIARAEFSGSEGCYLEIARWNENDRQWQRFAFLKCLDDDISGWSGKTIAGLIADTLNCHWNNTKYEKIFHTLPTFT